MKKILSIMLVLITLVSFVGCGNGKVGKITKEGDKEVYVNDRYGFKFEIPSEWKDKYEFIEAGGTDAGDKDVLKFQVDFQDKGFEKMIDKQKKNPKINLRIYVYKNVKTGEWKEEENYLGENNESAFTFVDFKHEEITLEKMKELFSIEEK